MFANTSNEVVGVWTNLPPQSLFVHPNNQRPVSIAWVSPISGDLRIVGKVQDAHPAALDGVSFKLEHIASVATGTSLKQIADVVKRPIPDPGPAPVIPVAYAVIEDTPSDAKLHLRGDPEKPGEVIPRRWIEVLGGQQLSNPSASGRQELSNWIVEHPLFARVIVNRVWHWHFGQGLVATPNDFGSRGSPPSHPELLGQLASQFVASGYSVKQLHRWIINTRAYQRSSTASQEQLIADPENRYLSHFTQIGRAHV